LTRLKEKNDRLNLFYTLENHAQGRLADEVFIIFEGRKWTYKEVYQTVLKYGTWLQTKYDVRSKQIVAMDFMNSDKFIFVWFGLWSIGAKPAFINYNLTGKALAHCIRVSTTQLILVDHQINITSDVRNTLPGVQFVTLSPELELEVMAIEGVRAPDWTRSEDKAQNMAKLVFTSGTTGLPKPAIVSWAKTNVGPMLLSRWASFRRPDVLYTVRHASPLHPTPISTCFSFPRALPCRTPPHFYASSANIVQSMPLYHSSASVLGFGPILHVGATICIGKKFSSKTFWDECRSSNATIIQYVGETCRYLLSAPPQIDPITGENLDKKNSVRMAVGNGLRPDVWNRFKERFGIDTISEFYAATEGSSGSFNYSKNDFGKGAIGRNGLLGWLLLRRTWNIVELDWETEAPWRDPVTGFCKKVMTGAPGEMLYKLDETDIQKNFQGYFNNTKSTEGKILRDVFVKGDAYFRTGDVMSWDAEGRTYFNDRIGDTFRWKSENVSTNEVSEALGTHPAVNEANVYGVELPCHDGRAGCVAIALAEKQPSAALLASLAEHAQRVLPRYAVPLFLRLPKMEMQTTGTNKQQKHVLRSQGVDPEKTDGDEIFWLRNGSYVKFGPGEWKELSSGKVKL
jgi:acyl-CoA synthetase (AMP-forming)/AMP-acid ligase II